MCVCKCCVCLCGEWGVLAVAVLYRAGPALGGSSLLDHLPALDPRRPVAALLLQQHRDDAARTLAGPEHVLAYSCSRDCP